MNRITIKCLRCKRIPRLLTARSYSSPYRPSIAPKPTLDIRHILNNADLYAQTCLSRNYPNLASNPSRIIELHAYCQALQEDARSLRERAGVLKKQLLVLKIEGKGVEGVLQEAREIKTKLLEVEKKEVDAIKKVEELALALPNLTSKETPRGAEFEVLGYGNADEKTIQIEDSKGKRISHIDIGKQLGIIDFASADTAFGYRWYYLVGAGALLEQALVSYALAFTTRHGWTPVSPPSLVYSHISAACGFQPRDSSGEQQVYNIAQDKKDKIRGVPEISLTRTSEIALAGMKANAIISEAELPLKRVAASRCYRAEAGAKGADIKGLYRVHEFTKMELFAWTKPDKEEVEDIFDEMTDIQTDILCALGLTCRVLDMPAHKLGVRETRKIDVEVFFPFRAVGKTEDEIQEAAWGEVASASICTDYQSRRLATRMRGPGDGKLEFPWTVNGTALAVPRVLAALLEIGWDGEEGIVRLPKVLHQFMGTDRIEGPKRK
ncbi:seryl-tRNA synthetase [Fusarium austroafricanum]|uniref:serine--tRNA ligase n=1 Tax=Fusarium austroafricanum TaxID=2364996 RepID=A0A8H4JSF5_9HYPO|nr:seryl-tRNA synthetase [Fusarium austroafricanum]